MVEFECVECGEVVSATTINEAEVAHWGCSQTAQSEG